jgi:hypothetical protein
LLFGIHCTAVQIGLNSDNDNRLVHHARSSCLVHRTQLDTRNT